MQISQINPINYAKFGKGSSIVNNSPLLKPLIFNAHFTDTFVSQSSKEKELIKKVFASTKKFSIRNYKKLNDREIEALRNICEKDADLYLTAQDNINNALILKSYLDNKYGKDKYVFCSIGRSPSGIARVFEFMGIETKYLPISGLRNYPDIDCVLGGAEGLKEYGKLLKKQGISNEEISKSDKSYLFYDFTSTGRTLCYFKDLLSKYYKVKQPNMQFLSLNGDLSKASENDNKLLKQAEKYINFYLRCSNIETYSGICELPVNRLFDADKCKKFESEKAKQFNFLVIDILNEEGLLKENSKNKKSL